MVEAVREKVRTIVQTFEVHGFPIDLRPDSSADSGAALQDRIATLERELDRALKSREPLEMRLIEVADELERDRHLRFNTLAQVGKLSAQLDQANATQEQLFAASRQCILSLRALREQLKGVPFAAQSLSPLVRDVKGVVDLIQELRLLSSIRSATADDLVTR